MKRLILGLLLSISFETGQALACQPLQITANALIPPWTAKQLKTSNGHYSLELMPVYSNIGYNFPFVVPDGMYAGITSAGFASKRIPKQQGFSTSYFSLYGMFTVTDDEHVRTFPGQPFLVPPGGVITGSVANASSTSSMNMNVYVTGWLSADPLFRDCR
jgi:hypothetical protein